MSPIRVASGESMAEYFMEGLIKRLLDQDDAAVRKMCREATFYCIPNMNPGILEVLVVHLCGIKPIALLFSIKYWLLSFPINY